MKRSRFALVCALSALLAACGDDDNAQPDAARDAGPDSRGDLFPAKPECQGADVVPLTGEHPMVISHLEIGSSMDGFDLDHDGTPDNQLAGVQTLAAGPIQDAFDQFDLILPIEFFDFPDAVVDECVKFGVYLGHYRRDLDGDGEETSKDGGDCNDTLNEGAAFNPAAPEIVGNLRDDNCDGRADEIITVTVTDGGTMTTSTPSADITDHDGDGTSMHDGDCDDTNMAINLGATEVCGNGIDEDCDGVADFGKDGVGAPTCTPFDVTPDLLDLDPLAFNTGSPVTPKIEFNSGTTTMMGSDLYLEAGPSLFSVAIPVTDSITLDLRITGTTIVGNIAPFGTDIGIMNGRLGGVLDAHTLDQVRGLEISQIGLTAEDSLLDAMFANILGPLLALERDPVSGCLRPDIDVDGDGLESFCDTTDDDTKVVDRCVDGDGTTVDDVVNGDGTITHCTEAMDQMGHLRFRDGVSIEMNFETVPTLLPTELP